MQNIFRKLMMWFTSGTEDFFTACFALFLDRNDEFRNSFLAWLETYIKDDFRIRGWTVQAQVKYPSRVGGQQQDAILDMVLKSPDLEIWFEHKVGAAAGKYGDIDQIQKYLDAANRLMVGVTDGESDVSWPEKGPHKGCPRVLLFYITRDHKNLDQDRYSDHIYSEKRRYGLVWGEQGHLRWREFWRPANRALDGALRGEYGEFERTLTRQFLGYWRSLPGMWRMDSSAVEWRELLPEPSELPEAETCGFGELWEDLIKVVQNDLGCSSISPWRGYEQTIKFPLDVSHDIDQIYVKPLKYLDREIGWDQTLGYHVLRLLLRPRGDIPWQSQEFRQAVTYEEWDTRLRLHSVKGRQQMEVLVSVLEWDKKLTESARRSAIAGAFIAALKVVQIEFGITFQGLERL